MAFWNRRRKEDKLTDGRRFKQADLSEFVLPVFVSEKELTDSDEKLINKILQNFTETGVIDNDGPIEEVNQQSIDELVGLIQVANEGALNEKDFHESKEFDEQLHHDLDVYEQTIQVGENFLLDGMDDYGNQIYESGTNANPVWD